MKKDRRNIAKKRRLLINMLNGIGIIEHNRAYAEQQARELRKKVIADKKVKI